MNELREKIDKLIDEVLKICKRKEPKEDFSNGVPPNHCKFCGLPIPEQKEETIYDKADRQYKKFLEEQKAGYPCCNTAHKLGQKCMIHEPTPPDRIEELNYQIDYENNDIPSDKEIIDKLNEVIRRININQ